MAANRSKLVTRPSLASKLMERGFVGRMTINPWSPERTAWEFPETPELVATLEELGSRKPKQGGDSSGK